MKEQLERRLKELKSEYDSGEKMLADLQKKQAEIQQTLLRIGGAIQVLQEELSKEDPPVSESNQESNEAEKSQPQLQN